MSETTCECGHEKDAHHFTGAMQWECVACPCQNFTPTPHRSGGDVSDNASVGCVVSPSPDLSEKAIAISDAPTPMKCAVCAGLLYPGHPCSPKDGGNPFSPIRAAAGAAGEPPAALPERTRERQRYVAWLIECHTTEGARWLVSTIGEAQWTDDALTACQFETERDAQREINRRGGTLAFSPSGCLAFPTDHQFILVRPDDTPAALPERTPADPTSEQDAKAEQEFADCEADRFGWDGYHVEDAVSFARLFKSHRDEALALVASQRETITTLTAERDEAVMARKRAKRAGEMDKEKFAAEVARLSERVAALTDSNRILREGFRTLIRKECETKNLLDASDAMRQMVGVAFRTLEIARQALGDAAGIAPEGTDNGQ